MIKLGYPISELGGYFGFVLAAAHDEGAYLVEECEGEAVGVDVVVTVEQVEPLLLLECAEDELLLLCVGQEEAFSEEGDVYFARPVDVVKDFVDEDSRGYFVVGGEELAETEVLLVEGVDEQLAIVSQHHLLPALVPPDLLSSNLQLMYGTV